MADAALVRLEVQVSTGDTDLIRAVADALRGEPKRAASLRSVVTRALADPDPETAIDVFGSDLADDAFAGVFGQPRQPGWRPVDL